MLSDVSFTLHSRFLQNMCRRGVRCVACGENPVHVKILEAEVYQRVCRFGRVFFLPEMSVEAVTNPSFSVVRIRNVNPAAANQSVFSSKNYSERVVPTRPLFLSCKGSVNKASSFFLGVGTPVHVADDFGVRGVVMNSLPIILSEVSQ